MSIAFLAFVYKNPALLRRVVEVLTGDESAFYIHVDAKSRINDFSGIKGPNVFFSQERIPVYWAEFTGVEAILLLMRQALVAPRRHEYCVLLSGSEYPIRSRHYIENFLRMHRGTEFISSVQMPAPGKPLRRINTLRYPSSSPVRRLLTRVLDKMGLAQRDYRHYLGNLVPHSGHTWWALTNEACRHILEFTEKNPRIVRFFANTFAPEEAFFQTILGNSPFKSRMRRNLVFEDWSAKGAHPAMITPEHLAFFESVDRVCVQDCHGPGELLFARKFCDDQLLLTRRIDEMIGRKEGARAGVLAPVL